MQDDHQALKTTACENESIHRVCRMSVDEEEGLSLDDSQLTSGKAKSGKTES